MATTEQIEAMSAVLRKDRCACGRGKKARKAFCASCEKALGHPDVRADRYKLGGLVGAEMVNAYLACGAWLFEQGYCAREVRLG